MGFQFDQCIGDTLGPGGEKFEQPGFYVNEQVRGEVFRHFGYFMTESTGHLSEYVPWFRKNQKALDLYCDGPSFGGESGAYYNWCTYVADKYKDQEGHKRTIN